MASAQQTDYLVVGTGGSAMAFVDTLLSESDAHVVMVDRHHRPGGHWNDAYPFVKLHQPSAWYGVASRELSSWTKDQQGPNAGLFSLASGAEVLAHFDQVMQQRFLPSGRVAWLPKTEYLGGDGSAHRVRSLTSGEEHTFQARRLVNATHAKTEVPSTHPPRYPVAPGVACIAPNALPGIDRPWACYTVVGSGKTGMDACLWLLENGVPPARIRWVMPRDAWLQDRANFQPGMEGFEKNIGNVIAQFESIVDAASVDDLFQRLEARGVLMRIDPTVRPTTYRCAVVSRGELDQLRRVGEIIRRGRVRAIEPGRLRLEAGDVAADPDTLYIDCTASAIQPPPQVPVFDGDVIHLLMVRWCQPLFSAALIAYVESHLPFDAAKNALCRVVPGPEKPEDWLHMWAVTLGNTHGWNQSPAIREWLKDCRLNGQAVMTRGLEPGDTARHALLKDSAVKSVLAAQKLPALLAQLG